MSPTRRRPCTAYEARTRYGHAVAYLETAKLVMPDGSLPDEYNHVAGGVAVLAAVAATDAICCRLLGERSRGASHREAVDLLATVRFGTGSPTVKAKRARDLAADLATVLDLKDASHYGTSVLSATQVRRLVRTTEKIVTAAAQALGLSI